MKTRDRSTPTPIKPTAYDVEALQVGFLAPDVFGRLGRVTKIFARGIDVEGAPYICYYTSLGAHSAISGSMKVGEVVASIPVIAKWHQTCTIPDHACVSLLMVANGPEAFGYEVQIGGIK